MSNSLRNKLALVLFFLLFLLGGAILALYIILGHSWNLAATEIDVGSGNMSNYMVIVLEGQSTPVKTSNAATNTNSNVNTNSTTNSNKFFNWDTASNASEEDVDAAKESSVVTDVSKAKDVGDAYANYSVKGADVLPLYSKDLSHYAQGEIYIKGDYKIGVLSLTEPESYQMVQQKIDNLYGRGANLAVVLTKNSSYLALTHGVDVCIVLDGKTQTLETAVENRFLRVKTGVQGSINAIIFSPNHVITAKAI